MKPIEHNIFRGGIILLCALSAAWAAAETVPIDALLEADWIEADQLFIRDHAASGDTVSPLQAFSFAHTRAVLERAHALVDRLDALDDGKLRSALRLQLVTFQAGLTQNTESSLDARRALYFEARRLLRDIAFTNLLLDMDQILFIKKHDSKGVFHMCDQYYGFNAVAGGGLFVLEDPFSPAPRVRDLLEGRVVEQGRLAGRSLDGGAFLSPELSFDGQTILFAWSEATGEEFDWTPEASYHLFRVHADGSGLVQLTDGPWNDFDPCFLPGGRVAFISERRGGYLRCGRNCPTYALFWMTPDGEDIVHLSYHETHEWHPSVNNDGMLVYTRWDYVDRDTNVAHHIWLCFPDGRDPRSFHGNYPEKRENRPWMEMDIRAIPNSHRYVATAAAHHGHAFGSLVLIDHRIEDDGAMSQLTRLTPDVPFPESERHLRPIADCMVYGTAWPLSEEDYLCVYGADAKNRGIYWIDPYGNRELLYRDPAISCLDPIPFRPRPVPPVIPDQTLGTAIARENHSGPFPQETVAVINVYDSSFDWPEGTRITALRIIQVLPKTTPPPNEPRIGIAEQTNARAILGTVPVEADGSAYFLAPPEKLLYFQAIDAEGFAVQSMRSGTYLQPGEQLVCSGCHEPKHRASLLPPQTPIALRRAPSPITPEPDGSNPFNYVRLVQPVLDRHCTQCHVEKDALDLRGDIEGQHGWTRSYNNLAKDFGFYFHVSNGSINTGIHGGVRTIPGGFGARAAKLTEYLDARHYDVSLTKEEKRRITLWLDANSEFFGAYENTEAQSRGEIVEPALH